MARSEAPQPVPVVLVHWNQPESCAMTIRRFFESTIPVILTVVDNGSETSKLTQLRESIERLEAESASESTRIPGLNVPRIKLIETGRNLGFGPGANVGLSWFLADEELGEWLAVAPHDVDPAENCLEMMLAAAAEHPMAGLMCADVGDGMVPVVDPYFGGMVVPADLQSQDVKGWESVDYPHGTLMMLSRSCISEIGQFDERYFSYCEEAQLATRASDAGFEIGLIRGARVTNTHIGSDAAIVDYLQTRNTLLFVKEHSGRYHAFIRLCIAVVQLLRGLTGVSRRPLIYHPRARVLGMRDFLSGRFGPPPRTLLSSSQNPG